MGHVTGNQAGGSDEGGGTGATSAPLGGAATGTNAGSGIAARAGANATAAAASAQNSSTSSTDGNTATGTSPRAARAGNGSTGSGDAARSFELPTPLTNLETALIPFATNAPGVGTTNAETVAANTPVAAATVGQAAFQPSWGALTFRVPEKTAPPDRLPDEGFIATIARGWEQAAPREWDQLAEALPVDLSTIDQAVANLSLQASELNNVFSEASNLFNMLFSENEGSQALMGAVFASVSGIALHRLLSKGQSRAVTDLEDDESVVTWMLGASPSDA